MSSPETIVDGDRGRKVCSLGGVIDGIGVAVQIGVSEKSVSADRIAAISSLELARWASASESI
jgi:hypothetical protein